MKKSRLFGTVCAYVLIFISTSLDAALISRQGGTAVFDTDQNVTWLADASYAFTSGYDPDGKLSWSDALVWADTLVFGGHADWRLPATPECHGNNCSDSELGHLYYVDGVSLSTPGPFLNLKAGNDWYWTGVEFVVPNSFAFRFADGQQDIRYQGDTNVVWAVADGDVFVPIPPAPWLFSSGLIGLVGIARRKKAA